MIYKVPSRITSLTKALRNTAFMMTVLAGLPLAVNAAEEAPQVQWVGDLPINPVLKVEPGLGFAFDSPEGRVVMVFLSGNITAAEMQAYYRQALVPLGWTETGEMRWLREGEALRINKQQRQELSFGRSPSGQNKAALGSRIKKGQKP